MPNGCLKIFRASPEKIILAKLGELKEVLENKSRKPALKIVKVKKFLSWY